MTLLVIVIHPKVTSLVRTKIFQKYLKYSKTLYPSNFFEIGNIFVLTNEVTFECR